MEATPHIIGLTGRARAGKDTAAQAMRKALTKAGKTVVIDSFASPIRAFMCSLLGVTLEHLEDIKEVPLDVLYGLSPRQVMQHLGTEWGRDQIGRDLWIRALVQRLRSQVDADVVIITDVRFDNEATAIRECRNGFILEIVRNGEGTKFRHTSELGVSPDLIDAHVVNSGTKTDLGRNVLKILSHQG